MDYRLTEEERELVERTKRAGVEWHARQAVFQADEAREQASRGYPYGSDSFGARVERTTTGILKVALVALPVGVFLLWLAWSVITG